jgi:hypothetical protein
MRRSKQTQLRSAVDVRDFPRTTWKAERPFYRFARREIDGKKASPWWFCNAGDCRFDLSGTRGTLYAGTDEFVGVLEYVGHEMVDGVIGFEYLNQRGLWRLRYDAPFPLANLSSGRSSSFGVSDALAAMDSYEVPQAWAGAFGEAGFEGIRHRSLFDTREESRALAFFDEAGLHRWPKEFVYEGGNEENITALARINIVVEQRPFLREVAVI